MIQLKKHHPFLFAAKQTTTMSIPLVGSRMVNATNRFISMFMIAQLGHFALAAGALITVLQTTLMMVAFSMMYAVSAVVSRYQGDGDLATVGEVTRSGLLLAVLCGFPLVLMMLFLKPMLLLFGQESHVVQLTQSYFYGFAFAVIPSIWVVCLNQFLVGISQPRISLISSCIALPFRLALSYMLIFGKFGFSKFGVLGLGYANAAISWLLVILILSYLFFNKSYRDYKLFEFRNGFDWQRVKQLFLIGWPISLQFGAELLAWSIATIMIGWLGAAALAAHQIVMQCSLIVIMVPFGMTQASAVLVGQAIGKKDFAMTKQLGHAGVILGSVIMVMAGIVYIVFPKQLASLFINIHDSSQATILSIAVMLFLINAFYECFDSARTILTGVLRGFHDTKVPMAVGIMTMWVISIPVGYVMAFWFHWGAAGIYLASLFGALVGAVMLWKRFNWHVIQSLVV